MKEYDYSQTGWYFITICTNHKVMLLGDIDNGIMKLNLFGEIVDQNLKKLPERFPNKSIDEKYVIMPNHIHFILIINNEINNTTLGQIHEFAEKRIANNDFEVNTTAQTKIEINNTTVGQIHEFAEKRIARRQMLLPKVIGFFKMNTAKAINQLRNLSGLPVWQGKYYDHIIRNEKELLNIRNYILNNPLKWELDELYK
jgi:REP element-mobilizing transposase RayT